MESFGTRRVVNSSREVYTSAAAASRDFKHDRAGPAEPYQKSARAFVAIAAFVIDLLLKM